MLDRALATLGIIYLALVYAFIFVPLVLVVLMVLLVTQSDVIAARFGMDPDAIRSIGIAPGTAVLLVAYFLLGFFLEATIGMIGFWFLEVSSLLFVYMLFNFFFSGHMFPLNMLPAPWDTIVQLIPLQYLAFFPAAVFLQKISGADLWFGLAIQAGWVMLFIAACRVTYWRGVKRYSGFGG